MKLKQVSGIPIKMESKEDVSTNDVSPPATPVRTWRHYTVGLVTFLFLTAYNISFYTFGQYVYRKLQREFYPNATNVSSTIAICIEDTHSAVFAIQLDVQQRAAKWGIYLYLSGVIAAVISSFIFGAFTDRFGRKFLFLFPCIGTIIRTAGVIVGFHFDLPLWYYAFGFFIEGCTGQVFNIFQVSYLYVVDITVAGKQRSIGIVLMEVAIGFGSIIPSLVTGYILQYSGSFQLPIIISCGMLVACFILMLTLPETFPKHIRAKRDYSSNFENLKDSVDLYVSKKNAGRRWMYIIMLAVFALTSYDLFGRIAVEGLYLLNYPLCWDPERIGLYGAARSGAQQFIGMSLVKVFHMCMEDEMIAIIGSVSYAASFVLEAFATNEGMMYGIAAVGTCGLLTGPMTRSILSRMTPAHQQGAVFASISATESLINLIGAISSNAFYIATLKIFRGFIFLLYAGLGVICAFLMIIFMIGSRQKRSYSLHSYEVRE